MALTSLVKGLKKTREGFVQRLKRAVGIRSGPDRAALEELEQIFVEGDMGIETSLALIQDIEDGIGEPGTTDEILGIIKDRLIQLLTPENHQNGRNESKPYIILIVGVNGTGKTTSVGKMAEYYRQAGKKVLLAAGDTYRAAAVEQLEIWSHRAGCDIVKARQGADPASVVFDAVSAALNRNCDVLLIDTAGRLQTKIHLMEELKKICRVIQKAVPEGPHETLLVLDATTGQNAVSQAREFLKAARVTGIILTKIDGTARGGMAVAVRRELGLPIRYLGFGEGIDDFREFDPEEFIEALFIPE